MRSLGVVQWDGIVLGPAPGEPGLPTETPEDKKNRAVAAKREFERVMYAAAGTVPRR